MKARNSQAILSEPILGLKANWKQFVLLVLINAFVGGMVGMERSILPQIAVQEFAIASKWAILSFIVVFGIVKAITNYFTGAMANKWGRKNLLILGWLLAVPIPFMLMYAPTWNWVVAANVLLGLNQGLAWSSTVVMKMDLVGPKQRGLAMGLNEFAGYLAVALVAFFTGYIAHQYGLRPYPFYIGIGLVFLGLFSSVFLLKDTRQHAVLEAKGQHLPPLKNVFWANTWQHKNLSSITQAGLVNNLNDGMVWGILPVLLISKGFNLAEIGVLSAIYPAVWGLSQIITGALSDRVSKKAMLFYGMLLQAIAILLLPSLQTYFQFAVDGIALGIGTAMVYPTFLSGIAQLTNPADRAESMGVFRFWRDLGYAIGALLTAVVSAYWNIGYAILLVGILTLISALILKFRMDDIDRVA
jgi:MFS family permease